MYKEWFSKFSIPTQIHMDGGKEFNVWRNFLSSWMSAKQKYHQGTHNAKHR
jgi:hypothetical protein